MVFVFKCLNGMTPEHLSSSLSRHHPAGPGLCSALDSTRLFVHSTSMTLISAKKRCFSDTAPQVWNNLPVNIRDSQLLTSFKRTLKTYLYSHYFAQVIHCFVLYIPFCNICVSFSSQNCDLDCSNAL